MLRNSERGEEFMFEKKFLKTVNLIKEFYLKGYTSLIAFSGGKDSTTVFQLFAMALTEIPLEKRIHTVYLEYCDTLLEAPPVKDYMVSQLDIIRRQIKELRLPVVVVELKPEITDTFFVNIIGKGYACPDTSFRFCTDRLKIQPTSRFMKERMVKGGDIYVVTGARSDESSTRARTLSKYTLHDKIKANVSQAGAFMFTPIEDWTTEDVWTFLGQKGIFNNDSIERLYEESNPDKDIYQGNRHGCWCCTVVQNDKALEQFIHNGYNLSPLLEFRAYLKKASLDPSNRHRIRRKGQTSYSLLTVMTRVRLLEELLLTQQKVGYELISKEELNVIDTLWQADRTPITVKQVIGNVRKGLKSVDQQSFNFIPPLKLSLKTTSGTIKDLMNELWEPNCYVEIIADQNGLAQIHKGSGDWVSVNRHPVWAIHEEVDVEYDITPHDMSIDLLKFLGFDFDDKYDIFSSNIVIKNTSLFENSFWHLSKETDGSFYCAFGVRIPSKFGGNHQKILGIERGEELSEVILSAREKFLANGKVFKVIKQARSTLIIDGQTMKTMLNQSKLDQVVSKGIVLPFFMGLKEVRADFIKLTFEPRKVRSMGRLMLRSFSYAHGGLYDIRKRALSHVLVPTHNCQELGGLIAIALGESLVKIELVKSKYKYNRRIIEHYVNNQAEEEALWDLELNPFQGEIQFGA